MQRHTDIIYMITLYMFIANLCSSIMYYTIIDWCHLHGHVLSMLFMAVFTNLILQKIP